MATTTKARPDAAPDEQDQDPAEATPAETVTAPAETPGQRRTRLRAELAELDREHGPAVEPPKPTHVLVLAGGETVETHSPVATHHYSERLEMNVPVTQVFEIAEVQA